jgi:hypothetical protein
VNFFSHAAIASLYTDEEGIVLGAMLPDFASLVRSKPPEVKNAQLLRGYQLHHATDRVFHDSDQFRLTCASEGRRLMALGVARGTALAAAHVGLELVLDDSLSGDLHAQTVFRAALHAAEPLSLGQFLHWGSAEQAIRFEELRQRLCALVLPRPDNSPLLLVERICRTLSQRPKLAVRAEDRGPLHVWTTDLTTRDWTLWPGLVDAVVRGLREANWNTSATEVLRFRRAQCVEV